VATGTTSASLPVTGRNISWAVLLVPVGIFALRRRKILPVLALCALMAASGCGAGRLIPAASNPGSGSGVATPSGSYNITVTATSSGLTRVVNLTLIVQ
jgi:hypothetical protein